VHNKQITPMKVKSFALTFHLFVDLLRLRLMAA